jgi:ephrin-B
MAQNLTLKVLIICFIVAQVVESKRIHYIHWNKANPMFRLDNTDHIVDVNSGNLPWEYDQVNIICPVSKPNVRYPERHVIYSVSREEFDSCRITNPKPKIVAVCSQPHQLLYFTITFRSFTPTPGGLEFYPGQDYYFISTSSKEDLHRRVGGGCSTHNMKMIFRVADNGRAKLIRQEEEEEEEEETTTTTTTTTTSTTEEPIRFNSKVPYSRNEYIYYYHPRDLVEIEDNSISNSVTYKKVETDYYDNASNEVWRTNKALRYTSSSPAKTSLAYLCILGASLMAFLV